MGDHSANDVAIKAPEDEAPVAQKTGEAGGTEVKEGFETSPKEGRVREGEDQTECTFAFVSFPLLFCFFLADMG